MLGKHPSFLPKSENGLLHLYGMLRYLATIDWRLKGGRIFMKEVIFSLITKLLFLKKSCKNPFLAKPNGNYDNI